MTYKLVPSSTLRLALCRTAVLHSAVAVVRGGTFKGVEDMRTQMMCRPVYSPIRHTMRMYSTRSLVQATPWYDALSASLRLVGTPTSQLPLHFLLSGKHEAVERCLRELELERHPLYYIIKSMIDGSSTPQHYFCSLVTLLSSKMMGQTESTITIDVAQSDILESQRTMAEVAQMCQVTYIIHRAVMDFDNSLPDSPSSALALIPPACSSLETNVRPPRVKDTGNKMAILCGDYLLARAFQLVASTRNNKAVMKMAKFVHDFTNSEFVTSDENEDDVDGRELWMAKTALTIGSLISNILQAAAHLAGHNEEAHVALLSSFGKHAGIAWQAMNELKPYITYDRHFQCMPEVCSPAQEPDSRFRRYKGSFSSNQFLGISSKNSIHDDQRQQLSHVANHEPVTIRDWRFNYEALPVVLHVEKCRRGQPLKEIAAIGEKKLLQEILSEGVGVDEGIRVLQEHCDEALRLLQMLPDNEARSLLQSLMEAVSRCEVDCEDGGLLL